VDSHLFPNSLWKAGLWKFGINKHKSRLSIIVNSSNIFCSSSFNCNLLNCINYLCFTKKYLYHSDISKVQFSMFSALLVTFKGSFTRIRNIKFLLTKWAFCFALTTSPIQSYNNQDYITTSSDNGSCLAFSFDELEALHKLRYM
jgi:hypothetical protein